MSVPNIRIRSLNDRAINARGDFVLYWMIAARRPRYNFALDRAVELAMALQRPLVVLEPLRVDYRWASERLHRFIIDGMQDNGRAFERGAVSYYPYIERSPGEGRGLLRSLSASAAAIVTDDHPCFFYPAMTKAAAKQVSVRFEAVDPNGILPMRVADCAFTRAYDFRRFLQKKLPEHLLRRPKRSALQGARLRRLHPLPPAITKRWRPGTAVDLTALDIDHSVQPVNERGGHRAAQSALRRFLKERLNAYDRDRNHPDRLGASQLSPWLHFGHLGAHQVFDELERSEQNKGWSFNKISATPSGGREGWWGMSAAAESYLDELIIWRELGLNMCVHREDYARWSSLPDWAKVTILAHSEDARPHLYSKRQIERAQTHDAIFNAAQRELLATGRMHNYLRMLWGKKIFEWSRSAKLALSIMIDLNNKYALDGRDPNSYSGIFWVLGRYDRAWPERPVYGKLRYMSSESTRRKLKLKEYLTHFAE